MSRSSMFTDVLSMNKRQETSPSSKEACLESLLQPEVILETSDSSEEELASTPPPPSWMNLSTDEPPEASALEEDFKPTCPESLFEDSEIEEMLGDVELEPMPIERSSCSWKTLEAGKDADSEDYSEGEISEYALSSAGSTATVIQEESYTPKVEPTAKVSPNVSEGKLSPTTSVKSTVKTFTRASAEDDLKLLDSINSILDSDNDMSDVDFSSDDDEPKAIDLKELERRLVAADEKDETLVTGSALKTKNEESELPLVEEISIEIPDNAKIYCVGKIDSIVNELLIIHTPFSALGEIKVLEIDTVLVLEDRTIIGRIYEVFGPVVMPIYSIRFNKAEDISNNDFIVGKPVYAVAGMDAFVETERIKKIKGSDASNMYDEEIKDEEREYSDDEIEQDMKRSKKQGKKPTRQPSAHDLDLPRVNYEPKAPPKNPDGTDDYEPVRRPGPGMATPPPARRVAVKQEARPKAPVKVERRSSESPSKDERKDSRPQPYRIPRVQSTGDAYGQRDRSNNQNQQHSNQNSQQDQHSNHNQHQQSQHQNPQHQQAQHQTPQTPQYQNQHQQQPQNQNQQHQQSYEQQMQQWNSMSPQQQQAQQHYAMAYQQFQMQYQMQMMGGMMGMGMEGGNHYQGMERVGGQGGGQNQRGGGQGGHYNQGGQGGNHGQGMGGPGAQPQMDPQQMMMAMMMQQQQGYQGGGQGGGYQQGGQGGGYQQGGQGGGQGEGYQQASQGGGYQKASQGGGYQQGGVQGGYQQGGQTGGNQAVVNPHVNPHFQQGQHQHRPQGRYAKRQ